MKRLIGLVVLSMVALFVLVGCGGGGGGGGGNTSSNQWNSISTLNSPNYNTEHSYVWTGTEIIFWGGRDVTAPLYSGLNVNSGAKYNPSKDQWKTISNINAPSPRNSHGAVWTGSEMIVWGGSSSTIDNGVVVTLNDGGRYDPISDTWRPISTMYTLPGLHQPSLIWTGKEVIVLKSPAGFSYGVGIYNPLTDTWRPMSTGIGLSGINVGMVCWTGTEVVTNTRRYNYSSDTWSDGGPFRGAQGAPVGGIRVCTDKDIIVYGAVNKKYNYATGLWTTISSVNAPPIRVDHLMAWTGKEVLVLGGRLSSRRDYTQPPPPPILDGASYDPAKDTWTPLPPLPHTVLETMENVFAGTEYIIFDHIYVEDNNSISGGHSIIGGIRTGIP